jgi:hypothetical protein
MSPYMTTSSALLTPPASYHLDTRRNSTTSTLSSLGPDTPIYGRSPFSNDSHVNVTDLSMGQSPSMAVPTSDCLTKSLVSNESFYDDWSVVQSTMNVEHGLPMRMHESYPLDASIMQAVNHSYNGLPTASTDESCWYPSFHSQLSDESGHVDCTESPHWGVQIHQPPMTVARTMVPSDVMLHDGYVLVDSNIDTDMSSYDDADVPLPPSPQHVVFRPEPDSSEHQRKVKRSIFISSTGGKTVKKEQSASGVSRTRTRKSLCKRKFTPPPRVERDANDTDPEDSRILVVEDNLHDIERDPRTNKLRRRGAPYVPPQICESLKKDDTPCGRRFRRPEHLHRHQRSTHSGENIYQCQMCYTWFNRVDNGWEHSWTHTRRPGKKDGRNFKTSLRHVLKYATEPKHKDKLLNKWKNELHYDYCPEVEQEEEDDEERRLAIWREKQKKRLQHKIEVKV